ncbi:hypothetical protein DPMN_037197 [Dreissena polymorpha]|uniref:Uncharacterized protein n=1 Tax=Dreissena polymorpha TaxID=45954 RepID=A0A9D4MEX5_DREPO|nr:hypothetical protein DPMN_037197 [Dreissena polymorpha]
MYIQRNKCDNRIYHQYTYNSAVQTKIYSLVRSPSPSSRTSSTLLGLLSSPRCSGLLADLDLPEVPSITSVEERQGGPGATFTLGGPRDSGTQYAKRTGETVSGMKTTAGDDKWAIKAELCAAVPWRCCVQT